METNLAPAFEPVMGRPIEDEQNDTQTCAIAQPASADAASRTRTLASHPLFVVLSRYAAPGLAAIALVMVLGGERADLDDDLHLIAPNHAVPGQRLPMRALIYTQLRAIEGPVLLRQPVDVVLETLDGRVLTRTQLLPANTGPDLEGELTVPKQTGPLRVRAHTEVDARTVRADMLLRVDVRAPAIEPEGRRLRALQQFSAGLVVAESGEVAPGVLQVRVVGGVCVPEQPCRALVHVGAPAAELRVEGNSTVTPTAEAARVSAATSGIVQLDFVTHGPEAELWLIAERAGRRVARRAVRLPIAMGSLSVQHRTLLSSVGSSPRIHAVSGEEGGCLVDAFEHGRWVRTGSVAVCDRDNPLPFAPLPPGIYRLQMRRDPFSAQTAAVTTLYVQAAGESSAQIVTRLASEAERVDPGDPFVQACLVNPNVDDLPGAAEYLAALLENGVIEPPTAVTGYAAGVAQLRERHEHLRNLSLLALGLGALSLVLSVGRRGLSAGARASELLARESLDPGFGRRTRARSLILVVASVLSLVLVFAVIALYVLARRGY